jgi:hypothetical protein
MTSAIAPTTAPTPRVGMKLGTQTGSVINHLYSRGIKGQPEPVVGMGVTLLHWSDRSAATIFRVFKVGKAVMLEVRDDHSKVIAGSGHDGSAEYEHRINVNGSRNTFRQRPAGDWERVRFNEDSKRWSKGSGGPSLRLGQRDTYRDPSF